MTGAYLRVKRNDKWGNIEVEHPTKEERTELFINREPVELLRWIDLLCEKVVMCETMMKELERDGIVERRNAVSENKTI